MFNPRQMNTCKYPFPPTQKKGEKKTTPTTLTNQHLPAKKNGRLQESQGHGPSSSTFTSA